MKKTACSWIAFSSTAEIIKKKIYIIFNVAISIQDHYFSCLRMEA